MTFERLTTVEGPVEPMPAVLPLNAMYLYPWMVILLERLLLGA
jgi:ESS family glutamate:Na+ symporter